MNCPPDVAAELVEILRWGLLRIRTLGYQGESKRCVYESEHLHNLPRLLIDYSPQLLAFYWQTERPLFMRQLGGAECRAFEEPWRRLEPLVERECANSGIALTSNEINSFAETAARS